LGEENPAKGRGIRKWEGKKVRFWGGALPMQYTREQAVKIKKNYGKKKKRTGRE